jgi:hypothetical protein
MNRNPDPAKEDAMVDAVLRDESWDSASAAFKAEALRVFRAQQGLRRRTRWTGSIVALGVVATAGIYWLNRPLATDHQLAKRSSEVSPDPVKPHDLSDKALLDLFPPGSCFIAEIDGKKELIFLDPRVKHRFVSEVDSPAPSLP